MKKLVSCLAFAMLVAFVTEAKAVPADNGPPALVAATELALQTTNESYDCSTQYMIAVSENPNGLFVTAVIDDPLLISSVIDNDVGWDQGTLEAYAGKALTDHNVQRDTGDRSVGALRAQKTT